MSPFDSPQRTTETSPSNSTSPSGGGGDVLLQWGQRKRSRVTRGAIEDSSSSVHTKQKKKVSSHNNVPSKVAAKCSSGSMLPPPPLVSSSAASNGSRSRKGSPRNLEDPSVVGSESHSRNSQCSNSVVPKSSALKKSNCVMERGNKRIPSASAKPHKPSSSSTTQASERLNNSHGDSASVQSAHEHSVVPAAPAATSMAANGDKVAVEVVQWPRIHITLSRKEKEDDFLAMKGTKIPQRPKKRAKNVDKTLQYCFPGMWLSELTKSRYEVREKKPVKKQKHRGLKGLESLESDSN